MCCVNTESTAEQNSIYCFPSCINVNTVHQNPNTTDSMTNKFLVPQWLKIFALEFDSIGGCVGFSSLHEKPDFRHCNHLQTSLIPTVSGCLKPVKSAFVCTINCQERITGSKSLATCSLLLNHTHYALLYSLKELPLQLGFICCTISRWILSIIRQGLHCFLQQ